MAGLTRILRLGSYGADVEAVARMLHRYLNTGQLPQFHAQAPNVKRTFGVGKRTLAKKAAKHAGLPAYGVVGPALFAAMLKAGLLDAKEQSLFAEYQESKRPKLVEPVQGFGSLHKSLWPLYSVGRSLGLTDLGTYNPASKLPKSGKPSDHAVRPAYAFDLGFAPATGYQHPVGRRFFDLARDDPAVKYVILGDKIWSPDDGLRDYTSGGHESHVHTSGRRS